MEANEIVIGMEAVLVRAPEGKAGSGHGQPIGKVVKIVSANGTGRWNMDNGCWAYGYELRKNVQQTPLEAAQETVEAFKLKLAESESKVLFLTEMPADVFNENEYKVWKTLRTLDDKSLDLKAKIKVIAALINR